MLIAAETPQYLCVDITERPRHCVSRLLNTNLRHTHISHSNPVSKRRIPTRRFIVDRNRSSNGVQPVLQIQILPRPVDTVDHSVMEIKRWVPRGREKITSGVTADGEMPGRVDAEEAIGEVALHAGREVEEVGVGFDKGDDVAVFCPAGGSCGADVAAETPRVVA